MDSLSEVYVRAFENLAERINSIRYSDIRLNQFIKHDIARIEDGVNDMIRIWGEGGHPEISNEMLLGVLELYQSDLKETEDGIRKVFGNLRELEFISTMNEMDSVNAAIEKISSLSKG